MAHTALGNVSAATYNTTQDKTLAITSALDEGTLLVAIAMGYGSDGTIDLTAVTDSNSNTWDHVKLSGASPSRFAMVAWTRIAGAMDTSDTVTINLTGTHTRTFAILRAYEGLGATEYDKDSAVGFGDPAQTPALVYSNAGRSIAAAFYPTEIFSTDRWVNSHLQTVNYNDATNVDTFTVGERVISGSGSVVPAVSLSLSSSFIIVGVTLPEQSMPSATRRQRPVVAM